jgi:DNA repair protein RecO (recombination protein O)
MKRVLLQPAYVLHRRPYRETSFIVEMFTADYGRVSVLAKGVRKAKSATLGLLQPFVPLLISFAGQTELMTLTAVEAREELRSLYGESLFAGFYLNELLVNLLHRWDTHPKLFLCYTDTLRNLHLSLQQKTLRAFEKCLLEELGYGVLARTDSFSPEKYYRFIPEQGFVVSEIGIESVQTFSGKSLLAIAQENWSDEKVLQEAKRLMRSLLLPLLGAKQLYSRQLFVVPDHPPLDDNK